MIVYMNPLHGIHMYKNNSSCLFSSFNGDVRAKHFPSGYNYNITDKNLKLPLRFPQFSSAGQARGITTNYRLSFSPVTWYLNGHGPLCYQIKLYTVCLHRDLRWSRSTTHYLWHSNKSRLLIKTLCWMREHFQLCYAMITANNSLFAGKSSVSALRKSVSKKMFLLKTCCIYKLSYYTHYLLSSVIAGCIFINPYSSIAVFVQNTAMVGRTRLLLPSTSWKSGLKIGKEINEWLSALDGVRLLIITNLYSNSK